METKVCLDCGNPKPLTKFQKSGHERKDGTRGRQNRCHACLGAKRRAYYKLAFLEAYGGKCSCCGESDHRFLTLDHCNSDGAREREKYNNSQIYMLAKKQGFPDSYRILCFNCNSGRAANGGVCPHQDGSAESAWSRLRESVMYIGRKHVDNGARYRSNAFGGRIKRNDTTGRFEKCQTGGRENTLILEHGTLVSVAESEPT